MLTCVASGGAWPFCLARYLVGRVICLFWLNEMRLNLLTSYAGHSQMVANRSVMPLDVPGRRDTCYTDRASEPIPCQ